MYHSGSVEQDFIISHSEEGKLKSTVKLYSQSQLTLALQKGEVSRCFGLMYFPSSGIMLFQTMVAYRLFSGLHVLGIS